MENLAIYNAVRSVPDSAKRQIGAGRLKGKTDINPMWRLKTLTEQFGPCGIGWKYIVTDKRLEHGANGEVAAFLDIDLFVKVDGAWSEAIPGTGGSAFVAREKNGLYTSDECFKMALTDAISVACKALGFGADIYWAADATKYTGTDRGRDNARLDPTPEIAATLDCADCGGKIKSAKNGSGEVWEAADISKYTQIKFQRPLCIKCMRAAEKNAG
jgi:hypothetical protein|nr:MAG TPA_asm: DNA repair protein-like protein [Caudoviricetes sp.]